MNFTQNEGYTSDNKAESTGMAVALSFCNINTAPNPPSVKVITAVKTIN